MLHKIVYTILGIGVALVFYPHVAKDQQKKSAVLGVQKQTTDTLMASPEIAANLRPPLISAKAALVLALDSGTILYSQNLDQKLPIASLTKLITALVVVNSASLDDIVIVNKEESGVVGSTMGLVVGEKITVRDLLAGMLISSSNDAAMALADFVGGGPDEFVNLMNQKALLLGLTQTRFSNPVGWDSDDNYSNTLDLAKLAREFINHPELAKIAQTKEAVVSSSDKKYIHQLTTTNKLLLEDKNVKGIKTGFTSKSLGSLIILYNHSGEPGTSTVPGEQVMTIVLDSNDREGDTRKLLDWIFSVYKW